MKTIRKLIIIFLLMMIISIPIKVCAIYDSWDELTDELKGYVKAIEDFKDADYGPEAVGTEFTIGFTTLRYCDEIYCLTHRQTIAVSKYKVVKYMELDGNKAIIPGKAPREDNSNIKLGLILSRYENRYGPHEGAGTGEYSNAQKALYMYLKDWLDWDPDGDGPMTTNREYLEFDDSYGDSQIKNWEEAENDPTSPEYAIYHGGYELLEDIELELRDAMANGTIDTYNAKIKLYFLECISGESYQKLVIAVPQEEPKTKLVIDKVDEATGLYLPRVSFTIKNETTNLYISQYSNGTVTYSPNEQDALEFTTGISSYKQIVIEGLDPGTYTIKEVRNPNTGYNNTSNIGKAWRVEVMDKASKRIRLENYKTPIITSGNFSISGTVWEDIYQGKGNAGNSKYDSGSENGVEGIRVYWKKSNGALIANTITDSDGNYEMKTSVRYTVTCGCGCGHLHYQINEEDKEKVNNSYIEFEYNGVKYTTVKEENQLSDENSVVTEIENTRTALDSEFAEVTSDEIKTGGYTLNYNTNVGGDYFSTLIQSNTDFAVKATTSGNISDWWNKKTVTKYESFHTSCSCSPLWGCSHSKFKNKETAWKIENINMGLALREQPDIAITSDINKVSVIMKNQEYIYYYNGRGLTAPSDELFDYTVKFSGKYTQEYRRPINPSDIAYVNYHNTDELQVYVTYDIKVKNQSTTLPIEVQEIVNYYDANYTFSQRNTQGIWNSSSRHGDTYNSGGYKAMYSQVFDGTIIQPGKTSDIVQIEYRVNNNVVQNLINGQDALLKNVSEIYIYSSYYGDNTRCSEYEFATQKSWYRKNASQYAGIDEDSAPGNAVPGNINTYEDDTDMAPTFVLCKDPNYKIISGLVWEDSATNDSKNNNERIGNGQYDSGENLVEGAQVQLLRINDNGQTEPAYLYYIDGSTAKRRLAVTTTDSKGNYTFGENTVEGVIVDNYVMKYTYGNAETTLSDFDNNGGQPYTVQLNTKINDANGNTITGDEGNPNNLINARNYKSTIITSSPLKEVIKGSGYSIEADEWHINHSDGYSVAVDDIEERKSITSLTYENFETPVNMSAYTAPFKVQIEYDTVSQNSTLSQQTGSNGEINIGGLEYVGEGEITSGNLTSGKDYENNWRLFDFGIIERPREDIVVDKTIKNLKITLANGQVLTEGNPYKDKLSYVKALGDSAIGDDAREDAANANAKFLFIEIDSESIQGARLDILYKITVTNNSEKDYEYEYDYSNIEANSNIIKDNKAYYYYFGEKTTPLIKSTVEWLVDYVDPELTCKVGPGNIAVEDVNGVNDNTYTYQENKDSSGTDKYIWMQVTPEVDGSGNVVTAAERLKNESHNLSLDANLDGTKDTIISNQYKLLSDAAKEKIEEQNYSIFITNYFYNVTPEDEYNAAGEKIGFHHKSLNLFASKLLANQAEEYTYENHVEILQLNGKIARNIDSVDDGKQIDKLYKPGDYIPSLNRYGTVEWINYQEGFHELDDDMITIRITPPTGLENNSIIYISVGAVALIALGVGIYFIKKKVLGR